MAAPHANAADGSVTQRYRVDAGPVAGHAEEPRVLHRHAAAWPAPGGGAHRQPGRHDARDRLRLAGRPARPADALSVLEPGPVLVPAAPGPHWTPDEMGLADRPDHPATAHRSAQRGGHLRRRRLPHDPGRSHRDQDPLAGPYAGAPARGLATSTWPGGIPPGRHAWPRLPGRPALGHVRPSATPRSAGSTCASWTCSSRCCASVSPCARGRGSTRSSWTTSTASTRRRRTGFRLTPGDAQNFLAYGFNLIHAGRDDRAVEELAYLSWWGRRTRTAPWSRSATWTTPAPRPQFKGSRQYGSPAPRCPARRRAGWTRTSPPPPVGR